MTATGAPQSFLAPQTLILIGAVIIIVAGFVAALVSNPRLQRWSYWCGWLGGTAVISCAFIDRGWPMVASAAAVGLISAVIVAYFRTPYLKLGSRIYAFTLVQSRNVPSAGGSRPRLPSDAYGNFLTAAKYWWTIATLSVAVGALALVGDDAKLTLGLAVLIAILLGATGHLDVREGFPLARRQFVQLGVVAISTIPIFLTPLLAYAATYYWLAPGDAAGRNREPEGDNSTNDRHARGGS